MPRTNPKNRSHRLRRLGLLPVVASAASLTAGCSGVLFEHAFFTGGQYSTSGTNENFAGETFNDGSDLNDNASSVRNNSGKWMVLTEHRSLGGQKLCVRTGHEVENLNGYKWNHGIYTFTDKATSITFTTNRPTSCNWYKE